MSARPFHLPKGKKKAALCGAGRGPVLLNPFTWDLLNCEACKALVPQSVPAGGR